MIRFAAATSLLVLLAATAPATAQTPPSGEAPAAPPPGMPKLNPDDAGFVHDAAIGGMAEVELGKLAGSKATDDGVKAFARRMVEDHGKANDELAAIAKKAGGAVPTELDQQHKDVRTSLEGLSGAAFDRAYVDAQVEDHQNAVQLFAHEVDNGFNAELKNFAAAKLPTLHQHLEQAIGLQSRLPLPPAAAPATGSTIPTTVTPRSPPARDGAAPKGSGR
jgi:putative membrane protein